MSLNCISTSRLLPSNVSASLGRSASHKSAGVDFQQRAHPGRVTTDAHDVSAERQIWRRSVSTRRASSFGQDAAADSDPKSDREADREHEPDNEIHKRDWIEVGHGRRLIARARSAVMRQPPHRESDDGLCHPVL
jgi:hypothetical protein